MRARSRRFSPANMAGTLAFLALPYLGQEGAASGSGGNLVLMAVVLHWLGFVLSTRRGARCSPEAPDDRGLYISLGA
jgi:hypothetical protein